MTLAATSVASIDALCAPMLHWVLPGFDGLITVSGIPILAGVKRSNIAQAETDWRSSPRRIQLPQRPLRQSSPSPFSHRWEPLNRPRQPCGT